jgi:hypothetical protein
MPSARSISGEIRAKPIWNSQACGMPTSARPAGLRSRRIAAMLPQALQRAERPAETLLGSAPKLSGASVQATASIGHIRPASRALDRDGQILILGQRIVRIAADLLSSAAAATRRPRRARP